jgi:mono/diheme cytochrome c family protein
MLASALVWAAAVAVAARSQEAAPPVSKSVSSTLDGVFTEAQAKRGQTVFVETCAHCHGNALEGGEEAPPLVGAAFIANWNGSTVGDLVERTRRSMPDGNPGTLSREQYTDVITFVLSSNRYPAGKAELPLESEKQKLIKIEAIKEAGPSGPAHGRD